MKSSTTCDQDFCSTPVEGAGDGHRDAIEGAVKLLGIILTKRLQQLQIHGAAPCSEVSGRNIHKIYFGEKIKFRLGCICGHSSDPEQ